MFQIDVDRRAEVMVLNEPGNSNAEAAFAFAQLVDERRPAAEKAVSLRYRQLREALETGKDVGETLNGFANDCR